MNIVLGKGLVKLNKAMKLVAVGASATLVMDAAGEAIKRTKGVSPLNLNMVGRWIGHMAKGTFAHEHIGRAPAVRHEDKIGLAAHYGIGIAFAPLVLCIQQDWLERPTVLPALAVGVGTSLAPWLWMQPAFGFGVMGSKLPEPDTARFRTIRAHFFYGLGLYLTGRALA